MVQLPRTVAIGRWVYSISQDADAWAELGVNGTAHATTFGMTNHHQLRIVINPATAARQKADTLLHEVLHCIWEVAGIVKRKDLADEADAEELAIGQLTPWLALTLSGNPELLAYINDPE